jgi:ABC-type glycerol-3-phosphate transport system substrate-binding protein
MFKKDVGLNVTQMYPAGAQPDHALADKWTWDAFLTAAEKCQKAGYPFGLPLSDSVNWVSSVFASNGAELIDEEGNITVKSDATKARAGMVQENCPDAPTQRLRMGQCRQ